VRARKTVTAHLEEITCKELTMRKVKRGSGKKPGTIERHRGKEKGQ